METLVRSDYPMMILLYTIYCAYVVRASILLPLSGPLSQRAILGPFYLRLTFNGLPNSVP
jgi:hypothetical protein